MTTHAWLDVSAGAAGDMILGALLDAGANLARVQAAVDAVIPAAVHLATSAVDRAGQRATKLEVELREASPHHRTWSEIRAMLREADLDERTRGLALTTFGLLAEAEGFVHGIDPEEVHFHEVGALDSIADVVGACAAVVDLDIEFATATPVALGEGRIRAAHGAIPIPAPAVAQLAVAWPVFGVPTTDTSAHAIPAKGSVDAAEETHRHEHDHAHNHDHGHGHDHAHDHAHDRSLGEGVTQVGELATPTGLALVRAIAALPRASMPPLRPTRIGIGAGTKDFPGWPNVVRVVLGEDLHASSNAPGAPTHAPQSATSETPATSEAPDAAASADDTPPGTVLEVRANVDDLDPRLWPGVLDALLDAGAVDAWLTPIVMKKGRPAHVVTALCSPERAEAVEDTLITRTSTLGTRRTVAMHRRTVERRWAVVELPLGEARHEVRVKLGVRASAEHAPALEILTATPEFEDVARVAASADLPEYEVLAVAQARAAHLGLVAGGMMKP